jgi:hypothetical protein
MKPEVYDFDVVTQIGIQREMTDEEYEVYLINQAELNEASAK